MSVTALAAPQAPARTDPRLIHAARICAYFFITLFVWIQSFDEDSGMGGPPIQFDLWPFQEQVLSDFEQHGSVVVLKARQLGLSWLALAYALWLATCNRGITVLILNRNLGAAIELLDRVRFMYRYLPPELQTPITQNTNDQKMPQVVFGSMNSRIVSLPSTEDSGSGITANLVLADEIAKWPWPEATFTSILPTLSGGGKIVAIFTAKGYHNYAAQLWKRALPGAEHPNGYWPIFIPTSEHPLRDEAWIKRERRKFPTERQFLQEHPQRWQDAFQAPGDSAFEEFDREAHHRDFERQGQWPVIRHIDFGYHHATCHWSEVQAERTVHTFSELHVEGGTTEELAQGIVERDRELGLDTESVWAGVDPAGKARTSQTGTVSDHRTLQRYGIKVRFIEPSIPKDRVDLIKKLLREQRQFVDCAACPYLTEALEQAQWENKRGPDGQVIKGESYQKDGYYEHPLDGWGYGLINVFPPRGKAAAARTNKPVATRVSASRR